jgi:hypothetical protein
MPHRRSDTWTWPGPTWRLSISSSGGERGKTAEKKV